LVTEAETKSGSWLPVSEVLKPVNAGLPEFMNSSALFQVSARVLLVVSSFRPDKVGEFYNGCATGAIGMGKRKKLPVPPLETP
jgi:hypothetical protein